MFKKKSISGWEDAWFGGYSKVLYDYPFITVPYKIDVETPNLDSFPELNYYTKSKLTDLFQLKIKEQGIGKTFFQGAKKIKKKKLWGWAKVTYIEVAQAALKTCLNHVIDNDTEMGNMFSHYKQFLQQCKFSYEIEEKDKESIPSEGGEEGEGEVKPTTAGDFLQAFEIFDKISKRGTFYETSVAITNGALKGDTVFRLMKIRSIPTVYLSKQTVYASQLLRMLDISFNPTSDKVPNLKAGKIDTGKLGSVPAGNHHVYYRVEENQSTRPFSVCILMDESGSMGHVNRGTMGGHQQELVKILYKAFSEILSLDKIFIYGHSSKIKESYTEIPEVRTYHDKYNHTFEQCIDSQDSNSWANNYDGPVIERVYEKVREQTSDNIIFISISDGLPEGHGYGGAPAINDLKRIIEKCKRDGFVTVGIGLQAGHVKDIYNYHTVIYDMSKMPGQVSTLINHVVKTEFQE